MRWARGRRSGCLRLRRDGLLELHVFDRLIAVTASGVGGGSLVYADIQMQPDDVFFDSFPAEITPDEMRPYYERVRDMLQPTPLPERPGRTALFEDAAAVAGLASAGPPDLAVAWPPTDAVGADRRASSYLLGCEYPGKRSLDRTYVPLALRAGAEVRPLSEVVALRRSDRGYRVHWIDHGAHRRFWVDAPIVVLAAGTLGTLRLLFAARENGAVELPPALGRNFSVGGDVMAFLYDAPGATDSGYGPCPGAGVLVEQHGQHRLLIGEMGVPADALPLPERVRRALRSSAVLAGMGRDASTGTIGFDGRELRTATDRAMDPALFDLLESAMAAIGHGYRARWMSPPGSPGGCWLVTVHPSGGAPIGTGPDSGVVDHTGQVFGNPGLHVADASLFPRTPGLPPAMTIAALAERQAALLGQSSAPPRRPVPVRAAATLPGPGPVGSQDTAGPKHRRLRNRAPRRGSGGTARANGAIVTWLPGNPAPVPGRRCPYRAPRRLA
ncbi:MAG: GMC oxidoreductase [Frankiaceae bacterium]